MQKSEKRRFAKPVDRWISAGLLTAYLLHNIEEALTFKAFSAQSQAFIREYLFATYTAPTVAFFQIALVAVSAIAAFAMVWALVYPHRRSASLFAQGLAWIMLLNVLLPHIPAAILLDGYSPGLITAVALNLPVAVFALVRLGVRSRSR